MQLVEDLTQQLIQRAKDIRAGAESEFDIALELVKHLGAHYVDGYAYVGFWAPELRDQNIPDDKIFLEVLTPETPIDLRAFNQTVTFKRSHIPLMRQETGVWGVIDGMVPGTRDQIGTFYWLTYQDHDGEWHYVVDPLAYSVPFGVQAPSEFYDIEAMHAGRADKDHFANLPTETDPDGVPRVMAPTNILQIHTGTACDERTLEGLTRIYRKIAEKVQRGEDLTPAEHNYIAYDAVQLMPIEPTIEYESGPVFWDAFHADDENVTVNLRRPTMTNWGYDVMIAAAPAVNPVLLGSGRPDEMVDFIATLHNFPNNPIGVILDIVYGHADNQSLPVLNDHFFAGPNMYGQNLDYLNPIVRAILLEMQRRKSNFGVDGVRVDGAQDFKYYVQETNTMEHDDQYLELMNNIEQEVAGVRYRPWMIFEDGRPWPRDDWELASTYLEVTKQFPNVFQWGPLTFAHNTPFKFTFWISKWWRMKEIARLGNHWITGCANHDTLRRGTQVDPNALINTYLGNSLPEIFRNAYDNAAANMLTYAFMPGVPMDFINALMRAPWSFIRNTDDRWGVKVVSEEAYFLDWVVNNSLYNVDGNFMRLKRFGFTDLSELQRFMRMLDNLVKATNYNIEAIANMMNVVTPPLPVDPLSADKLKQIARAWMDDVYDYCNVSLYAGSVDPDRALFNFKLREFRQNRPWLMDNLKPHDTFEHIQPLNGRVLIYGMRESPAGDEQVLFIANMEGSPITLTPSALPIPDLAKHGWEPVLASPGCEVQGFDMPVTVGDSQSLVFVRKTGLA